MKVLIFGASGFIGKYLVDELQKVGHSITAVSRSKNKLEKIFEDVGTVQLGSSADMQSAIRNSDAIINLAGASLAKPWTRSRKEKIRKSRIDFSRQILDMIGKSGHTPKVFLQGSAIGIYGDRDEDALTEEAAAGNGFLANVVQGWEDVIRKSGLDCRKVYLRTGLVLGNDGGLLPLAALPVKMFLGGHIGNGKQWYPWIHVHDEVRVIRFVLENEQVNGPVNLVSPGIVRQKEFIQQLAAVMNRPSWLHIPSFVLKGLLGEMAREMLLPSQKVIPAKLMQTGFDFEYKELKESLIHLLK
ncbi:MAG: TIGR01777 family oxidoreductase [Bacteroidota bacterium]|nr:TIGR01777 family oxidoreductase [Bacteroidota bacterium]